MRTLLIFVFLLLPLSVFAEDPAQSPRDASAQELLDLTMKLARSLGHCPVLKKIPGIEIAVVNHTEDYIDRAPLEAALKRKFGKNVKMDSPKVQMEVTVSSEKSVSAGKFKSVYSMTGKVVRLGGKSCEKSERFEKLGSVN